MTARKVLEICLDMDNTLVALDHYLDQTYGVMSKEERHKHWDENFQLEWFMHAPLMPGALDLLDYCCSNFDNVRILTALPHNQPHLAWQCMEVKLAYAQKKFGHAIPVTFGPFSNDKYKHCGGRNYVLVDDLETNVIQWMDAGGKGILFKSAEQAIEDIRRFAHSFSNGLFLGR